MRLQYCFSINKSQDSIKKEVIAWIYRFIKKKKKKEMKRKAALCMLTTFVFLEDKKDVWRPSSSTSTQLQSFASSLLAYHLMNRRGPNGSGTTEKEMFLISLFWYDRHSLHQHLEPATNMYSRDNGWIRFTFKMKLRNVAVAKPLILS